MKYITYFVTLFAYASIHMMRMSIPFVQLKLMDFFKIDKFQMGLANALLYIVIGISYFWRALYPIQERQFTYLWSMSLCNLSFLIIPVLISFNAPITPMFYICLAGFGFFHTVAWPTLLSLVHAYFLPKRDGCMLGFWSANGDIGNILGFAICTFITYNLNLPFQACLYTIVSLSIIMSLCVYKIRIEPDQINQNQLSQQEMSKQDIINQYKKTLKQPEIGFMLVMLCILKGILYGILLWLPMYFEKSGFKQYQGYIPMVMNGMAILGSVVLGIIYQKISNKVIRAIVFMSTLIITCVTFFIIRQIQFTVQNRLILQILVGIIGFCVMGNFNVLITHEVTAICDRLGMQITAFSSLVMSVGTIFVGIIQIIIGQFATDDINSVFLIFFIMTIVLIVIQVTRIIVIWCIDNNKNQQNNEPLLQNKKNKQTQVI